MEHTTFGEGKDLLLLHGWGGSSESFSEMQKLLAHHFRVTTIDLPGFGKSDAPQKPWSLDDYVQFLSEIVAELTLESFSLAGHSFGGRVAIKFALKYPEKLDKLILIAPAGIKRKKSPEEKAAGLATKVGKRIFSLPMLKKFYEPARWLLYKMLGRYDYYKASTLMRETMKLAIDEDLTPLLTAINIPTLIIWGDKDTITPTKDAKIMHEKIKHSQLEIIKGGGHDIHRKNASEVALIIFGAPHQMVRGGENKLFPRRGKLCALGAKWFIEKFLS